MMTRFLPPVLGVAAAMLTLASPDIASSHDFRTLANNPIVHWHYHRTAPTGWVTPGWYLDRGNNTIGNRKVDKIDQVEEWSYREKLKRSRKDRKDYPAIVRVLRLPTKKFNCHGYSFRIHWHTDPPLPEKDYLQIEGQSVVTIATDQGWAPIPKEGPFAPGDIVLWKRKKDEHPQHSGVVHKVSNGKIILVDSKWGQDGLYRHWPVRVRKDYGQIYMGYRRGAPLD